MRFKHNRFVIAVSIAALMLVAGASMAWATSSIPQRDSRAQEAGSPTAVQLQFPTATETPGPPSETPTRTPTSQGRPWIEAIADATNVRAGPDIDETNIGKIYPGTTYPILGKRFQWYWIEYPEAPAGNAWVHESVVTVGGDETLITNLEEIPTTAPELAEAQETANAITLTPGLAATMTAQMLVTPTGIFTPQAGEPIATRAPGEPLPTFTFPPYTPTPLAIPRVNTNTQTTEGGIAPILPIMALGALGLMGLIVATLRRL